MRWGGYLQDIASAQLAMRWGGCLQDIASAQLAMRWGGCLQDIASAQLAMRWGGLGGERRRSPLHTEFGDQVDEVVGVEGLGGVGDEARGDGALAHLLAGVGRERHSGDRGGA